MPNPAIRTIAATSLPRLAKVVHKTPRALWEQVRSGKLEAIRQGRTFLVIVRDPVILELLAAEDAADAAKDAADGSK